MQMAKRLNDGNGAGGLSNMQDRGYDVSRRFSDHFGAFRIDPVAHRIISDRGFCRRTISELFGTSFSHENDP
jgi:hypothetical protein